MAAGRGTSAVPTASERLRGLTPTREEALLVATQHGDPGRLVSEPAPRGLGSYAAYVRNWLDTADEPSLSTLDGYRTVLEKYALPVIVLLQVEEITTRVVAQLLRQMKEAGRSPSRRPNVKAAIGSSFKPLVPETISHNPAHGHTVKPRTDRASISKRSTHRASISKRSTHR